MAYIHQGLAKYVGEIIRQCSKWLAVYGFQPSCPEYDVWEKDVGYGPYWNYRVRVYYEQHVVSSTNIRIAIQGKADSFTRRDVERAEVWAEELIADRVTTHLEDPSNYEAIKNAWASSAFGFKEQIRSLNVHQNSWEYDDRFESSQMDAITAAIYTERILLPELFDSLHSLGYLEESSPVEPTSSSTVTFRIRVANVAGQEIISQLHPMEAIRLNRKPFSLAHGYEVSIETLRGEQIGIVPKTQRGFILNLLDLSGDTIIGWIEELAGGTPNNPRLTVMVGFEVPYRLISQQVQQ